jgi:hypothetical protein
MAMLPSSFNPMKLELSRQKKTTGVSGGTALSVFFRSGINLSMFY